MSTAFGSQANIFKPTQISGCQLWLDAADPSANGTLPSNGTTVSTWTDKSGGARNATSVTGTPTYSVSAKSIVFNGSTYYSLPNNTLPSGNGAYSIFFVSSSSLADYHCIFGLGTNTAGQAISIYYYPNGTIENGWWTTNVVTSSGVVSSNQINIIEIIYDVSSLTTFINGTSRASSSSLGTRNGPAGPTNLGARMDSSASSVVQGLVGNIHETLAFNSGVSSTQRQQIEGYLAWKWGLQANLPSTHPYKNTPLYQLPPLPLVTAPTRIINSKPGPSQTFPNRNTQGKSYFIDTPLWFALGVPTSNFSSALPITLAGNASYTSNVLQLTPNSASQTGTAFLQTRVRILRFSTQFNLRFDSTQADGATFCIQNSSSNALGGTGGGLGYSGITNSVAIRFDSYNGSGGNFSTDVLTGGTVSPDQAGSGVLNTTFGLTAGTTWNFLINASYDGTTLSYTIRNFNNLNQSFTSNRTIDIGTTIGSSNAWIGFTSATGGATETCSLISWNWSNSK